MAKLISSEGVRAASVSIIWHHSVRWSASSSETSEARTEVRLVTLDMVERGCGCAAWRGSAAAAAET